MDNILILHFYKKVTLGKASEEYCYRKCQPKEIYVSECKFDFKFDFYKGKCYFQIQNDSYIKNKTIFQNKYFKIPFGNVIKGFENFQQISQSVRAF